ncbi:MAG: HEAT repeat domain-containing protein [Planctomycetaceae bacterium]|nr:HEAT repeat domain-containing protein [Planctomycetaceae bacterium]
MTQFQDKVIRFIGKSENPAAVEILVQLLSHTDIPFRKLAFGQLYLKKLPEVYVLLFKEFLKNEEFWGNPDIVSRERLAKLTDAALRDPSKQYRQTAADVAMKYNLNEILPTVILCIEAQDQQLATTMRKVLLHLAEAFFEEIANAPEEERPNFDRKREWFVSQLDPPIKRYAANKIDELIQSLLIVTKKNFETMELVVQDHRSAVAQKMTELLREGTHRSYLRILLNYVNDPDSPGMMDEIIANRSDALFVRKMLEVIGTDPDPEFQAALSRFPEFAWFKADNPELPSLVEGLEPNAVQLLHAASLPKEQVIPLYRFFLERESVESRRAAAEAVRWLVGEEINKLLLNFVNNSDPETTAILFRLLKSREVHGVDDVLPQLIERNDPVIRQAIYDMMPELRVETFASRISQMTPMTAQKIGHYVRLVDLNTHKVINDDIKSPIPIRRSSACRVATVTGYAHEFLRRIVEIAEQDDEMQVRLAAISALSTIMEKEALETLKRLMTDRATDIRDAVERAIKTWAATYRAKVAPST